MRRASRPGATASSRRSTRWRGSWPRSWPATRPASLRRLAPPTKLKVTGIDLFSAGDFAEGEDREEIVLRDATRGVYKRLVLQAGHDRALERLEVVDKPWEGWKLQLSVARTERSGDDVARLSAAVIERGAFRLGPIDVSVSWAERIAIVGPNGSGKSTLLAALLGRLPLASGSGWVGPGVVVGELDQARRQFLDGRPLIDGFTEATKLVSSEARSTLAKFGLGADHIMRPADQLSPGERTRASLAVLMSNGSNLLVLDEPTNHLDLPAIEQLEIALDTWDGTLLLVTHDRRFLDAIRIDRTIELG